MWPDWSAMRWFPAVQLLRVINDRFAVRFGSHHGYIERAITRSTSRQKSQTGVLPKHIFATGSSNGAPDRARPTNGSDRGKHDLTLVVSHSR